MDIPRLSQRFEDALVFAAKLHADDIRKGTRIPYLAHLLGTVSIALEHGATEDEAIAALLHDAVEDHGLEQLVTIRDQFGEVVADIVAGCTDADVTPKPPWRARKESYVRHLEHAPASVRRVSASDKLHNARSILADYRVIGEVLWSRFSGGKAGGLWYSRALVDAFPKAGMTPLIEELDRVVSELERLTARA